MWYPTNTRLPGGKILINGGYAKWMSVLNPKKWDYLNRSVTIFDPAAYDAGEEPLERVGVPREGGPRGQHRRLRLPARLRPAQARHEGRPSPARR